MTVPEQIERSVAEVAATFSRVDILVNNLGLVRPSAFMDMTLDLWESVMSTNVTAAMLCSQSAARHMARHGYGSIVNISSQAAEMSAPGASAYAVSKAAINGLTRAMAVELVADNIRVNAVAPHHIMTPATNPQFLNEQRIPMNRTGTPEEVAHVVAFFASERASFVTGQCLNVNGGFDVNMFNSVMYSGDRR
jgi:NAD(P)-dependent dehydrogenase (short-subunit alcohol dehydrogenase family)